MLIFSWVHVYPEIQGNKPRLGQTDCEAWMAVMSGYDDESERLGIRTTLVGK